MTVSGRSAALIRAVDVGAGARRLAEELRPYFGDRVFFLLDRYDDLEAPPLEVDGATVRVGGRFLERNGLPRFARVGWQCGDFMYYAAAQALPDHDLLWLIEDDVSFRVDVEDLFGRFDALPDDLLVTRLRPAGARWRWTRTMQDAGGGPVHQAFFPVSRLTRRAALHALEARRAYTARFDAAVAEEGVRGGARWRLYANDEAFLATTLIRDGFVCTAMDAGSPTPFGASFTYGFPVHPDELAFIADQVVHPVCEGERARARFARLLEKPGIDRSRIRARVEEHVARCGEEGLAEFVGLARDLGSIDGAAPESGQAAEVRSLLEQLRPGLRGAAPAVPFVRAWIHDGATAVCEFQVEGRRIAFDIARAGARGSWQVEVLARRRPDLGPLASLAGERVAANRLRLATVQPGPSAADEISGLIRSSLRRIAADVDGATRSASH